VASFQLPAAERDFLAKSLARLPGSLALHFPVTVDLNGAVAIRGQDEGQTSVTELVLAGATRSGEPIYFNTNRRYLIRALEMGFETFHVFDAQAPVLCQDAGRQYVWALLDPALAIKPADDAIRIESPAAGAETASPPPTRRKIPAMAKPKPKPTQEQEDGLDEDAKVRQDEKQSSRFGAVEQAEALQAALREAASQAGELVRILRRDKRQARQLQTALASLREIQAIEV
jgi:hypothetical protein